MRTVGSGVDIEVHSSRPFPVRDDVIVLRIGDKDFLRSRAPADGNLNTLIFSLSAAEFSQLKDGDRMTVGFASRLRIPERASDPSDPSRHWDFGTLDRSRLDR
jgi:hypothetical protein